MFEFVSRKANDTCQQFANKYLSSPISSCAAIIDGLDIKTKEIIDFLHAYASNKALNIVTLRSCVIIGSDSNQQLKIGGFYENITSFEDQIVKN